jgi:threonine/homoserine/homoserine lactone efflux protein
MIEASWLVFALASLVLIATPGQDMILVMSRSVAQGAVAGVVTDGTRPLGKLFVDGALSNLSNPKVAIFYFAFLPQFVSPSAQHPTLTVFALGLAFAALTFAVKAPVGLFAGALSAWLRSRPSVLAWVYRFSGAILVALGVRLALERR